MTGAPLGEVIYSAVKPMIRTYMIIFTGFFLTRKGLFGVATARACSDLVLMIFMPALVFDKIVSYISIDDIKTIGVICFSAFILYCINACVAYLIVKFTPVPKGKKDRWVGGAMLAGIMQNVSDLPISYIQGMSILSASQSNKGTAYIIIWLAMYVVAQFNCGLFQLVEWDFKYAQGDDDMEKSDNYSSEGLDAESSNRCSSSPHSYALEKQNDTTTNNNGFQNAQNIQNVQNALVNENAVSATTTINSLDNTSLDSATSEEHNHDNNDHSDAALDPQPFLQKSVSRLSRHNAIARIPSARSFASYDGSSILSRPMSLNEELVREYSHVEPYNQSMSKTMKIITETNLSHKDVEESGKSISFIKRYHLHYFVFFLQNFRKPNSIVLIISITLALIPWTKALFTNNGTVILPNAPDKEPALSFVLIYAEYLGYPCVPLGLLLIGSVLARLEIKELPKGFWKSAVCHTLFRLCILPIIGTAWVVRLKRIGWLTDPMAMFATCMEFALPSATVQVYLTAGAMRPGDKTCAAMNCLGLYLIMQYVVLVVSLPIVVCYCVKKVMDF